MSFGLDFEDAMGFQLRIRVNGAEDVLYELLLVCLI